MEDRFLRLYVPVQQMIVSYWMGVLPPPQITLLLYINERTLRYGKDTESIPKRHFLKGVTANNGQVLHNGLNIAHTALWKHLAELENTHHLIHVQKSLKLHVGNKYSLHLANLSEPVMAGKLKTSSKNLDTSRQKRRLKVSKKAQETDESEGELVRNTTGGSSQNELGTRSQNVLISNRYINNRLELAETKRDRFATRIISDFSESVEGRIQATKERSVSRREQLTAKADSDLRMPNIKAAWENAVAQVKESDPTWDRMTTPPTGKTVGILKKHIHRIYPNGGYRLGEIFYDTISRWDDIRLGPMAWHTDMPRAPHFDFVAYQMPSILKALQKLVMEIEQNKRVGVAHDGGRSQVQKSFAQYRKQRAAAIRTENEEG
jgi:hypothetical protein